MSKETPSHQDFFSPQKRFSDTINSSKMFILDREIEVFGKTLRAGSVIRIIAWREIENVAYLVINRGTWESLIKYEEVAHLIQKTKNEK
jgi:hypothetical protein